MGFCFECTGPASLVFRNQWTYARFNTTNSLDHRSLHTSRLLRNKIVPQLGPQRLQQTTQVHIDIMALNSLVGYPTKRIAPVRRIPIQEHPNTLNAIMQTPM